METSPQLPLSRRRTDALLGSAIWITLVVLVLVVYGQVAQFEFVNYDDPSYVYDNPHVQEGVTVRSARQMGLHVCRLWDIGFRSPSCRIF